MNVSRSVGPIWIKNNTTSKLVVFKTYVVLPLYVTEKEFNESGGVKTQENW